MHVGIDEARQYVGASSINLDVSVSVVVTDSNNRSRLADDRLLRVRHRECVENRSISNGQSHGVTVDGWSTADLGASNQRPRVKAFESVRQLEQ